jgi:hypothetical protein
VLRFFQIKPGQLFSVGDRLEYQRTVVEEGEKQVVWQNATIVKMITSNPSMYVGERSGGGTVGGGEVGCRGVMCRKLCVASCACRKLWVLPTHMSKMLLPPLTRLCIARALSLCDG